MFNESGITPTGYHVVGRFDCEWCDKACRLLEDHGIRYFYHVYDPTKPWARLFMKTHGFKTVPQIFDENYEMIGGYDQLDGYLNGNYKS